jgi:DNA mismatch repair protein MutS2
MDERNLKRLEFDRVKEKLAGFAVSNLGRELIDELVPYSNRDEIIIALAEVTEGRELLRLDPTARLDGWNDVRSQARRCDRGALLDAQELWYVLQTLTACRQIKSFFSERQDRYVRLNEIALGLGNFRN